MEKTALGHACLFADRGDTYVTVTLGVKERGCGIQYLLSRVCCHHEAQYTRPVGIGQGHI